MSLSESDPPLFYALLQSKLELLLPVLYTPTGERHRPAQQVTLNQKLQMV